MKEITLNKAIMVKGKEVKVLKLDFDKITGRDLIAQEKAAKALGETPPINFTMAYQGLIAAKAAGIAYDDLLDMPGTDFNAMIMAASSFLFVGASTTEEASEISEKH